MTHEHFKIFLGIYDANEFLSKGHIIPKSISVTDGLTVIGYIDSKSEHLYTIVHDKIQFSSDKTYVEIENILEIEAKKHSGVVCQDVHISYDNIKQIFSLDINFLVLVKA